MPTKNLTVRFIDSIKPPKSGRVEYWDSGTPGFGLRVSASGRKVWVAMYRHRGRLRRMTLGTYPTLTLADARDAAADALRAAAKGKDPAGDKKADRLGDTFREVAEDYIEIHAKVHKRSWREDRRALDRDLLPRFGHRKAADIKRREVIALLDQIKARGAPVLANRTLEIVRRLYNWGIAKERVDLNPCAGIERFPESSRDRVLTEAEIRAVWKSLDTMTPTTAARVRLGLLTAARPGELRRMRWSDIDLDTAWWTIPAEMSKNRMSHRVPLVTPALDILDALRPCDAGAEWIFPSPAKPGPVSASIKPAVAVQKAAGVTFRLHDLRRTVASFMGSMGAGRFTISRVLGHVEAGVTAVYDRHTYDPEKRKALEAWARRLEEILAGKSKARAKVVPLRPA